jgi:hypothetical protein
LKCRNLSGHPYEKLRVYIKDKINTENIFQNWNEKRHFSTATQYSIEIEFMFCKWNMVYEKKITE